MSRPDNYAIHMQQAKARFLGYDQEKLIQKLSAHADEEYIYATLFHRLYRIHRKNGDFESRGKNGWQDSNTYGEVMTLLDLICDCREDRFVSGRWKNMRDFGNLFYSNKADPVHDPDADFFSADPQGFADACRALGGTPLPQGDVGYALEVFDGLPLGLQLWLGDEEFPSQLKIMWDANALQYLRFETMHFAIGVLMRRLREEMQ